MHFTCYLCMFSERGTVRTKSICKQHCKMNLYMVSGNFSTVYNKKLFLYCRIGSNLHAVVVSTISLYCFIFDVETASNPIKYVPFVCKQILSSFYWWWTLFNKGSWHSVNWWNNELYLTWVHIIVWTDRNNGHQQKCVWKTSVK